MAVINILLRRTNGRRIKSQSKVEFPAEKQLARWKYRIRKTIEKSE